ncbi:hypothetical protein SVIOM342S_07052 [Streptomyces violaceorubidus]
MAEHDSDREDREDREERDLERERREGRERAADGGPEAQDVSFDEDAAWAAIVAGYGEEPPDPPGSKPFKSVEDLALLEPEVNDEKPSADRPASDRPLGGSVAFAPGAGPRDHTPAEPSDDDFDADDEGHFVPPPLPDADPTAKFAWLGVLGGRGGVGRGSSGAVLAGGPAALLVLDADRRRGVHRRRRRGGRTRPGCAR